MDLDTVRLHKLQVIPIEAMRVFVQRMPERYLETLSATKTAYAIHRHPVELPINKA